MVFRVDPHRARPRRAVRPPLRSGRSVAADLPDVVRAEIAQQLRNHAVVIVPSVEQVYDVVRTEVVRQLHEPQAHRIVSDARTPVALQAELFDVRELEAVTRRRPADLGGPADGSRSALRVTDTAALEARMRRETLAAFGLDPDDPSL